MHPIVAAMAMAFASGAGEAFGKEFGQAVFGGGLSSSQQKALVAQLKRLNNQLAALRQQVAELRETILTAITEQTLNESYAVLEASRDLFFLTPRKRLSPIQKQEILARLYLIVAMEYRTEKIIELIGWIEYVIARVGRDIAPDVKAELKKRTEKISMFAANEMRLMSEKFRRIERISREKYRNIAFFKSVTIHDRPVNTPPRLVDFNATSGRSAPRTGGGRNGPSEPDKAWLQMLRDNKNKIHALNKECMEHYGRTASAVSTQSILVRYHDSI